MTGQPAARRARRRRSRERAVPPTAGTRSTPAGTGRRRRRRSGRAVGPQPLAGVGSGVRSGGEQVVVGGDGGETGELARGEGVTQPRGGEFGDLAAVLAGHRDDEVGGGEVRLVQEPRPVRRGHLRRHSQVLREVGGLPCHLGGGQSSRAGARHCGAGQARLQQLRRERGTTDVARADGDELDQPSLLAYLRSGRPR